MRHTVLRLSIVIVLMFTALTGCQRTDAPSAPSAPSAAPSASPAASATTSPTASPTTSPLPTSIKFPIPPRFQWDNANGYCGETSIQSIALYYGVWVSQQVVRDAAGSELLLDENAARALTKLKFNFESWDDSAKTPQFEKYMKWMKTRLLQGFPCITMVFLADSDLYSEDYDHIVPVVGVTSRDSLLFYTLYSNRLISRPFSTLAATRDTCDSELDDGGNIPQNVDYGIAMKGLKDANGASYPTRLRINRSDEPNVSLGETAVNLKGTVTVSGLKPGKKYALLRYDDLSNVPTSGDATAFLASNYDHMTSFTAETATWTFVDPVGILSSGATYYRCVAAD
ncbi:MAG: hypothetical protein WCL54_02245 [Clostridia bacterium]